MPPINRGTGKEPAVARKYVWHKLRNTGVDYSMILRERRQWLLNQDLAKSEPLLCEWYALVQELDTITREELGVDKFGTKVVTAQEENERRARSRSFQVKPTADHSTYGVDMNRPRSNSFLEFLLGQEDATSGMDNDRQNLLPSTPIKDSNISGASSLQSTPSQPKKIEFKKKKHRSKHSDNVDGPSSYVGVSVSVGGSVGHPSPKKKKKSKTPNKALKKMFKVVEKKASAKGGQPGYPSVSENGSIASPAAEGAEKQKSWL